ncbi:type II secretion system F family protein [Bacillus sp. 1P06AnD]|uniref:type II secretion system F family protein n=1 Tax=Bacillus sp. 1P06AnD TaxID=3132208 RepID=UPI00399F8CA1
MNKIMLITVVGLTIISILTYISVIRFTELSFSNKRQRLSNLLRGKDVDRKSTNKVIEWLEKKNLLRFISSTHIMHEAKKYGVTITKQSYLLTFLIGSVLGVIIMFVYFRPVIFLLPLSIIGGFIANHVQLQKFRKKYIIELDSKISIYMSAMATASGTFGNVTDALRSILPSLEEPIKGDVEEALIMLQDGKTVRVAFSKMNQKYKEKHLKLFHDQLDAIAKSGMDTLDSLRKVAFKMKRKETYRRRLKTEHKQSLKAWKTFVFLNLSAPFLFIIASMDNYNIVMNHIATSIVFLITFSLIFVTWRQLEKLEIYDPTADEEIEV